MTDEDIIRMAWKAGFERLGHTGNDWVCYPEDIERFAALVASAEREACAKAIAYLVMTPTLTHGALVKLSDVVNAIRARGQA